MSKASPEALQLVKNLMEVPENSICADCQKKAAKWASSTLGTFICIDCSGIHRNLGTHISFVRSCTLDSWTPDQARLMKRVGNKRANEYWEARLPQDFSRPSSTDRFNMEAFIRAKYVEKRWAAPGDPPQLRTAAQLAGAGAAAGYRPSVSMYNGYFQHNPMAQQQQQQQQQQPTILAAKKSMSISRSNDNLENVRKPATRSASMGLNDFMNMMNQGNTPSDDAEGSPEAQIPPQSPVAVQTTPQQQQQQQQQEVQQVPQAQQLPQIPQLQQEPQQVQNDDANSTVSKSIQAKKTLSPRPPAVPTTGSTARDIMMAAANEPQGKKQRLFGKRGGKGVSRFMKRPSNDAVFDQMLQMSENSSRPESAPVYQIGQTDQQNNGVYNQSPLQ